MKRLISVLTVLCLLLTAIPLSAWAQPQEISTLVNPLYADVLDREPPVVRPSAAQPLSGEFVSRDEAMAQMRTQMKSRQGSIVIKVKSTEEDRNQLAKDIFNGAMAHTGQPAEGDNLRWHWTKCNWSTSRKASGSSYNYTITYSIEYYTDAAQEAELDAAVEALLDQWSHLEGASDLEKISTIYDYITANVEYGGNAEGLQYTSYGALINGTCVCQGYANLFYRLALELGVDNRIVTGWAGLGGHAWNLVELDGLYYYVDSTWDAGETDYAYFLKGSINFDKDHTPNPEYTDWLTDYNISKMDLYLGTETWPITGACGDDLTWSLTPDGLLTISGTGAMWASAREFSSWRQYSDWVLECVIADGVTTVSKYAFSDCTILTDISIGSSVASIGAYAFEDCTNLASVVIPDGVTAIGEGTFINCERLASVTIPDSVTCIGDSAFEGCGSLTSAAIPEGITYIGAYAFGGCSGLTGVNIPAGITAISKGAFSGCSGLTGVTIPDGVTAIGGYAFQNCWRLPGISIPESVNAIGNGAFNGCSGLTSVNIPEGVTAIGSGTFRGCSGLTGIHIPENVTTIGDYAFDGCSGLTSVNIPEGITAIGSGTFHGCSGLTSIHIPENVTTIGDYAFDGCSGLTSVTIPGSVTVIGDYAFCDCYNLPHITIPDSVTTIGTYAFGYCDLLTGADLPGGITEISSHAFCYCLNLTDVTIPEGVCSIAAGAFRGCGSLASVTIPDSMVLIGEQAFDGCGSLTDVHYGGTETKWANLIIEAGNDCLTNADIHCYGTGSDADDRLATGACGDGLTWVLTTDGTLTISGTGAMWDFSMEDPGWELYKSRIQKCLIGDGVTTLGDSAFNDYDQLTEVTIGNSVTEIGAYAFDLCDMLSSVNIGQSVTRIEQDAFYACRKLTGINIPQSVTDIGRSAFQKCVNLRDIYYGGSETQWLQIEIGSNNAPLTDATIHYGNCGADPDPDRVIASGKCGDNVIWKLTEANVLTVSGTGPMWDYINSDSGWILYCSQVRKCVIAEGVTTVGEMSFCGCDNLTEAIIGDSVTVIGGWAFAYCPSLTDLTIGGSVATIDTWAFGACESLTHVTIPVSVTAIGGRAFYDCANLEDVYYGGSEDQWTQIEIGYDNECLTGSAIHYNHTAEPEILYGDANGDGRVNSLDVILLRQYLADWDVAPDLDAADANGDGQLNSLDVIRLRQYLADWDVTLGPQ